MKIILNSNVLKNKFKELQLKHLIVYAININLIIDDLLFLFNIRYLKFFCLIRLYKVIATLLIA